MTRISMLCCITLLTLIGLSSPGSAEMKAKEAILYRFTGASDGIYPAATPVFDSQGSLYGTTVFGGTCAQFYYECGTVFKISAAGMKTTLHQFAAGADGAGPHGALVMAADGTIYGTTYSGGLDCDGTGQGCGTIFKVTPGGREAVLYRFAGGSDGSNPYGGIIADAAGNFYGTTEFGGEDCDGTGQGCGTVFELGIHGKERIVYAFKGGSDGANPIAGLIMDGSGTFFGATYRGGADCFGDGLGCGTVFRLAPDGNKTVLHAFQGGNDGADPAAAPTLDQIGYLYGTTDAGGPYANYGVVYKITPGGKETVLHAFTGTDGRNPSSPLAINSARTLFGVTPYGGSSNLGVVFRLTQKSRETVLHSFSNVPDGAYPFGGVLLDQMGELFGTTAYGGSGFGYGTVFRITY